MRRYATEDEERIRTSALVREWTRSGLLDTSQGSAIEAGLRTELRRTNRYLRAVLFIFGTIVVWAAVGFCLLAFNVTNDVVVAWSACAAGGLCFVLAEYLVFQLRLYRFGVEEAFAVWSVALLGGGLGHAASIGGSHGDWPMLVGLLTATIVSVAVYFRFGYLYAALAAGAGAAAAPFFVGLSHVAARLMSVSVLLVVFSVAQRLRRPHQDDFPGGDYGAMQAAAWLGIYAVLNLRLSFDLPLWFYRSRADVSSAFYWGTFAAIWALPVVGLFLGIRGKHRILIWANAIVAVTTLVTNKPYLGWEGHSWDPILLGVLLTGTAVAVRQWLSRGRDGQRRGFTPHSILHGDRQSLAIFSTLAGAAQPFAVRAAARDAPSHVDPGGGGRSGGGGGGAEF